MVDRQVRIIISADVAGAIAGFRNVQTGLGGISEAANNAQGATGGWLDNLRKGAVIAGLTTGLLGIGAAIRSVVSMGVEFERALNVWSVVTLASTTQMQKFSAVAKELGNDVRIPGVRMTVVQVDGRNVGKAPVETAA